MTTTDLLAGLAILLGLAGIVVPVLPGALLILVAVIVWAAVVGSGTAWAVAGAASVFLLIGAVVKYTVPGRRLEAAGVPRTSIVIGGLLGIIGFFLIPLIGLFVGFLVGVYLAEVRRLGQSSAWPSTKAAVKAAGLSILIELASGLLAAAAFIVGVVAT
ncbi:MAG TPA: DUF456 domain-containing protein [Nocardioidaceae bacterium]|nr:DUF456 domain-containing protein [Nocardioidaceae bacterium]